MTPREIAALVTDEAAARDLVVGPVVLTDGRVQIWLSAAHPAGRTATIDTDGGGRFSLGLDDFPRHACEDDEQEKAGLLRELVVLAALHLWGHTALRPARRFRREFPALEVPWEGEVYVLTKHGRRRAAHR